MSESLGKGRLMVISGPAMGKTLTIEPGQEATIGSDPDCQLCIEAPGVSPIHARVAVAREGATIEDTQSPHGIFVNNKRVEGTADLHNAAILSLGPPADAESIKLQWKFKAIAPAEPPPLVLEQPAPATGDSGDLGLLLENPAEAPEFVLDEPVPAPSPAAARVAAPPGPPPAPAAPTKAPARPAAPPAAAPAVPSPAAKPPVASAPAVAKPAPAAAPKPAPPPPQPAAPPAEPALPPTPVAPAAKTRPRVPLPAMLGIAAALLALIAAGIAIARPRAPRVEAVAPARVHAGDVMTISGRNFGSAPADIVVSFGELPGRVAEAADDKIQVEVPAVAITAGRPSSVPVTVTVKGRRSAAAQVTVYELPRITGITPAAAEAGEEVVIAGSGFAPNAKVVFGKQPAEVAEAKPTTLRVKVPDTQAADGASVPVTVTVDADASASFPLLIGHLPLVVSVEPAGAAPGDTVIVKGRGFGPGATVRVGGVEATVSSAREDELKVVLPAAPAGEAPVEVRMPESEHVGRGTIALSASTAPPAAPTAAATLAPLRLEGTWSGSETEGGIRRFITVTFKGFGGGAFKYETMGLALPLMNVQPIRGTAVRFQTQRGAMRYYIGTWDGQKISGTIASDAAGKSPIGTFELSR
jgi:hypothetical protein